jgi:hypothetical protein
VVIQQIETSDSAAPPDRRTLAWLGVSTEEASDALSAQLGLDPGVGLVVTYLSPEGPAAKAGLRKHDLLVEFEGQPLSHPAQLRRLVQSRKAGDAARLTFFRAGKKESASAVLGKTQAGVGLPGDEHAWNGDLRELHQQLRDLRIGDTIRQQLKVLRNSLGDVDVDQKQLQNDIQRSIEEARKALQESLRSLKVDQKQIQEEVRRSMAEARKALEAALRNTTNAASALGPAAKALADIAGSGAVVDDSSSITVRRSGQSVKTLVKNDDAGSIVLVNQPRLHLTARDKQGRLLFDADIATAEEQSKVPPALWEKVKPLVEELEADPDPTPEPAAPGGADTSSRAEPALSAHPA